MSTELAWAAGFFDGEGHSNYYQGTLLVKISQNHTDVLDRFQRAVGVGTVAGPYSNGRNPNPKYQFSAFGKNAERIMGALRPYLSSVKSAQWDAAVAKRDNKRTAGIGHNGGPCLTTS